MTDCHLFADPQQSLRGVDTRARFTAAIEGLRARVPDADLLVLTGDTAHDEQRETYLEVREALSDVLDRVRIVPGNHDNRAALSEVFPQTTTGPEGRVTFEHAWSDWQVIGLDSQRPGESPGSLGPEQLEWLEQRIEQGPAHTLLFWHHPPIGVGSPWLDRIGLQDAPELSRLIASHPGVRLVCSGHVHQELAGTIGSTTVLTTPAVGPGFHPRTAELEIDASASPACRLLELSGDGTWRSQVLRFDAR